MKYKRWFLVVMCFLLVLTGIMATIHIRIRDDVPKDSILVKQNEESRYVAVGTLILKEVTGSIVNGKGEETAIHGQGIGLGSLSTEDYQHIVVTADDEYSATVLVEEVEAAYLLMHDDGSVQLVVFGDSDSKRAVRNVTQILFE